MAVQGIAILGSTGSVGVSTLDVIARHPDRYKVIALTAHRDTERLAAQCLEHSAPYAVIADTSKSKEFEQALAARKCATRVLPGRDGLREVVAMSEVDTVMAAIVGAAGLEPTLCAVQLGKRVLLANKESMVIAGPLFERAVKRKQAKIIPVDSEHNALFQALPRGFENGLDTVGVRHLVLTASGGPFLNHDLDSLDTVSPEQACAHPNWDMGRKISVDSATLMNKGLEVIEARWLFNASADQIRVVIHPQSIVHSMVEYRDGSVLSQMGVPDMRTPIAHALAWPDRIEAGVDRLDLTVMDHLEFRQPDLDRFPCLALAYQALDAGGNSAIVLNAANEVAVEAFLQGEIGFMRIPALVQETLEHTPGGEVGSLGGVLASDRAARQVARECIGKQVVVNV